MDGIKGLEKKLILGNPHVRDFIPVKGVVEYVGRYFKERDEKIDFYRKRGDSESSIIFECFVKDFPSKAYTGLLIVYNAIVLATALASVMSIAPSI